MEGESEIRLIFWLGTSVVLLLVLGVFFLAYISQNHFTKMKHRQLISDFEKKELNQRLLLTQMNPHFIFNSIDNIQSLIYNKQDQEAINYLTKFSKLTRQILENSSVNYIALAEEIEMIGNYLVIQQLLYDNKFKFKIEVDDSIETESVLLPPMLTQPFIENAIKHGLKNSKENGQVEVRFYLEEDKLFFEVSDNGNGFDLSKEAARHKSLAMAITKERLVNYSKNKDFSFKVENGSDNGKQGRGAKILFEIPYIYEK